MTTALVEELDVLDRVLAARVVREAFECGHWLIDVETIEAVRDVLSSAEQRLRWAA